MRRAQGRRARRPEGVRRRDVRAREQIIVALFNGLPAHLHGALSELRTVLELVSMARETTTFLLGYEIGREAGRHGVLARSARDAHTGTRAAGVVWHVGEYQQ